MANQSIYNAFERMWQHVIAALGNKANKTEIDATIAELETKLNDKANAEHTHDTYETKTDAQTKLDEAKEYVDENVNMLSSNIGVKTPPIYRINKVNDTNTKYFINVEDLEEYVRYCVVKPADIKNLMTIPFVLCNDGTEKNITSLTGGAKEFYVYKSGTKIILKLDNSRITVDIADKSTKDNVVIESTYLTDYLATSNSFEFTPTSDYNPATKKYVDDSVGNIDLSTYETTANSQLKLDEAKAYADSAVSQVKDDLLNGAGEAYDTLKELGDLINVNVDAIEALETVATGKADKVHGHEIADVNGLQTTLDEISEVVNSGSTFIVTITGDKESGYTADKTFSEIQTAYESGKACFVKYGNNIYTMALYNASGMQFMRISQNQSSTFVISKTGYITVMESQLQKAFDTSTLNTTDKTIVGAINEVHSELDSHNHDDIYYTQTQIDTKLEEKANASHTHAISDITNLQTTLDDTSSIISNNTDRISALESKVEDGLEEVTSEEISALFSA